ncbi:AAA domain-containing protein [Pseudonocardia lacus]|uniref:AAA domain-containing protein n=1 Tax=Pseudonocardia lacus TaxID=2835865 RepID=UPI001BDC0D2D|nr:AAA domain-containing protein [Pseudonocardia lacus]
MTIPSRRRALLIHIEHYDDPRFPPLTSARAAAERLAEALREDPGAEVAVRSDLTSGALRATVARFCADRDPDELALVYLACRATVGADGELVVAGSDTDPDNPAETGLTGGFLARCLGDCWAEQKVALLDCPDPGRRVPATLPSPTGVYLIASDPAEESPAFTDAVAAALRAGAEEDVVVTTDDLADAADLALRDLDPPRSVTVSAVRVGGRIPVLAPALHDDPPPPAARAGSGRAPRPPQWRELLAYYRATIQAGAGTPPLLDPDGTGHVLVGGRERALLDDVDDDGLVPVPPEAAQLVASLERDGPGGGDRTLWAGWPLVVLHGERDDGDRAAQRCAPLLVRRLEVVPGEGGARLRPIGQPVPHLGLAHLLLGAEEATALATTWVPGWHRGEASRIVTEADRLLREDLGLHALDRLDPERLGEHLDRHSPLDGARNLAVVFTAHPSPAAADVLADLDAITRTPDAIGASALAALLPDAPPAPESPPVALVTPQALTATQRAVLRAAMTRRLTAVTGAPGTGKTRLVVDAVATAVAAGQRVLVAAASDRAVEEIVERCRRIVPGLLVRAGHPRGRDAEAGELDELLALPAPRRDERTREMGFRYAEHLVGSAEEELRAVAAREAELLALGRARTAAHVRLGHTGEELTQRLGPGWGERARELAGARLFGELRRRRFLHGVDLPPGKGRTAETCVALAALHDTEQRWRDAGEAARAATADAALRTALATARQRLERASGELLTGVVLDGVDRGRPALAELRSIRRRGAPDRAAFHHVLRHLRGWAVTAAAAHRIPPRAALYDLVVIDEAQHCSLPEAVPLLFRARRALVVGDPAELPLAAGLPSRTDCVLRERHAVARHWLARHRLSPVRHSLLAAVEQAAGGAAVLDEHFRSHPAIAALGAALGPRRPLHVLTDIGRSPLRAGRAVMWRHITGLAERGPQRTSWRNPREAEEAVRCARRLLERLPRTATVGIVTPYRAQADELARRFAGEPRVSVGTPSSFQGHEHDAMVLSLVADSADHRFDRAQRQPELWTVALSRARYLLVVVGDRTVWRERGGVGGALLAASGAPAAATHPVDDLSDRLDNALSAVPGAEREVAVRGHAADAVLGDGGYRRPVLIDRGAQVGTDPAVHLARMLRLIDVLGDAAIRLPGWILHDSDDAARSHIV